MKQDPKEVKRQAKRIQRLIEANDIKLIEYGVDGKIGLETLGALEKIFNKLTKCQSGSEIVESNATFGRNFCLFVMAILVAIIVYQYNT